MKYRIAAAARTITGRRKQNQDAYVLDPSRDVFVVLDGMGGQAGGEVASSMAAETIAQFYARISANPDATWPFAIDVQRPMFENQLDAAIRLANRRVFAGREGPLGAMGTTVASLALSGSLAVLAHLGDSRVYRLRGGELRQLTRDHSLYEQMLDAGIELPPLSEFIHANVITRALGPCADERPELTRVELAPGDRFLLCTDGLSGDLTPEQIAALLGVGSPQEAADALIDAAYAAGSRDNITAMVVEIGPVQ